MRKYNAKPKKAKCITNSKPLTTQRKKGSPALTLEDIEVLKKYNLVEVLRVEERKKWKV